MAVIVECVRGSANKEGDPITDPLIVNDFIAARRGKRYLDDPNRGGYYNVVRRTISTHHKGSHVLPRLWITIGSATLNIPSQKVRVKSYTLQVTKEALSVSMVTEQFKDPESDS